MRQRSLATRLKQPESESMRNTIIIPLSQECKELRLFLLLLSHWALGGLSVTLKKALKRIVLLADSRNYQSQGHAIAIDRLAQLAYAVIVRGSTTMLLARFP